MREMNWTQWANDKVQELIDEINEYIDNGVCKKTAINIVKSQTSLSSKYWEMVLEGLEK
jgi:hypothetical protein